MMTITKKEALDKIRSTYSDKNYVTGMCSWDKYYIFHIKAKDPDHKMEFNQPFSVMVDPEGNIGTINLLQKAKDEDRYDEYLKACEDTYEDLDQIPKEESEWFINKMLKDVGAL